MRRRTRDHGVATSWTGASLAALAAVAGCNAAWGIDDLAYPSGGSTPLAKGGAGGRIGTGATGGTNEPCSSALQCPSPQDRCLKPSCDDGTCGTTPADEGTRCAVATCDGDDQAVAEGTCDAMGECRIPAPAPCGAYRCHEGACLTDCTEGSHEDCADGYYCGLGTSTMLACMPTLASGSPCAEPAQCESGYCIDGHCCTTECSGPCDRCTAGTCLTDCAAECASEFGQLAGYMLCSAGESSCRFFVHSPSSCGLLCGTGGCLASENDAANSCSVDEVLDCATPLSQHSDDGICTCGHIP